MKESEKLLCAICMALSFMCLVALLLGLLNLAVCWEEYVAQFTLKGLLWRIGLCAAMMPVVLACMIGVQKELKKHA